MNTKTYNIDCKYRKDKPRKDYVKLLAWLGFIVIFMLLVMVYGKLNSIYEIPMWISLPIFLIILLTIFSPFSDIIFGVDDELEAVITDDAIQVHFKRDNENINIPFHSIQSVDAQGLESVIIYFNEHEELKITAKAELRSFSQPHIKKLEEMVSELKEALVEWKKQNGKA